MINFRRWEQPSITRSNTLHHPPIIEKLTSRKLLKIRWSHPSAPASPVLSYSSAVVVVMHQLMHAEVDAIINDATSPSNVWRWPVAGQDYHPSMRCFAFALAVGMAFVA